MVSSSGAGTTGALGINRTYMAGKPNKNEDMQQSYFDIRIGKK
ncbi:hypothetical protein [Musicola paradisiaca]|nr:hypothetical protein [Musicola paradisiaca]